MKRAISTLIALALMSAGGGCVDDGPGAKLAEGRVPARARQIPPPPKPRPDPIDPALQSAARQELQAALRANEPFVRVHAIEGLRDTDPNAAAPAILEGLRDPEATVRYASAMAAGDLKLAQAKPLLTPLLREENPKAHIAAIYALHRLGDTSHSHDLEHTALSPDPLVRGMTALVLGRLGEPSGVRILRKLRLAPASADVPSNKPTFGAGAAPIQTAGTADPNAIVREQAAEALWLLGDSQGLQDLIGWAASQRPDDQMVALMGLAARHDSRVQEHIRAGLSADYPEVRLVAARALAMVSDVNGPYDLGYNFAMEGARSNDPRTRSLAALALGAIGRTDAQGALGKLLKDPDPDVRVAAATALLQIGKQPRNAA